MQLDRHQVIDFLRSRGEVGRAERAQYELPGRLDVERHAALLGDLGVDVQDLLEGLDGGATGRRPGR